MKQIAWRSYLETMRSVLTGEGKSFVLFENGTVIIFVEPDAMLDLPEEARLILRKHGPVYEGSAAGDFELVELFDGQGWVVTYDHPDMLTLVLPDEVPSTALDVTIGLIGRSKRERDAADLVVVHVEDQRQKKIDR